MRSSLSELVHRKLKPQNEFTWTVRCRLATAMFRGEKPTGRWGRRHHRQKRRQQRRQQILCRETTSFEGAPFFPSCGLSVLFVSPPVCACTPRLACSCPSLGRISETAIVCGRVVWKWRAVSRSRSNIIVLVSVACCPLLCCAHSARRGAARTERNKKFLSACSPCVSLASAR